MASTRLPDYLGSGVAADRPASPSLAADTVGLWYSTDTNVLSAWDGSTWEDVGGGSVTDFTDLGDVPASYTGEALKVVRVNAGETGLEFATPASATLADGDYGDVTVSGSGTVIDIDAGVVGTTELADGAVTLAKQADMATASVVYRKTAGSGAPEVQTLATLKTDLGLTGTNSGDQTITLTGDVTGSGTGSFATTLVTTQTAAHTWSATQTFGVAPVFTDASGSRTALGLGSANSPTFADVFVSDAAGVARDVRWQTAGVDRWIMRCETTAESGSNAGSNLQLLARTDAGGALGMVWSIDRATQVLTFNQVPVVGTAAAGTTTTQAASTAFVRTPAIQSVSSSATVTPTFADDAVKITAQAAGLTLANPTGTAIPMHGMVIRIKDNGTARSISYGTQYRAIGVTLPTTTVVSKTLYLAMIYNSDDTKWDVVAVAQEA